MKTVQEFAATHNISINIVNTWIYRHGLPVIQIGRRVYIDEAEYVAWRDKHRKVMNLDEVKENVPVQTNNRHQSSIRKKIRRIY